MKALVGLLYLTLGSCYELLDRKYSKNSIDIHIGECPIDVDHISMIFEAANELTLPGNYRQINWFFDASWGNNTHENGRNEILFKYLNNEHGYTQFQVLNNNEERTILEFDMVINPYGLTRKTLYNIILHEMTHIFLLGHGEYSDSIAGFVIGVGAESRRVIQSKERIKISRDDCYGIYQKMIDDIIVDYNDYEYANNLNNVMLIHCPKYRENYYNEINGGE